MSGQAGYFLAMGLAAMGLGAVVVALMAAGYYGDLDSRLRYARRRLAAMESGARHEAGPPAEEMPESSAAGAAEEDEGPYRAVEGEEP